MSIVTAVEQSGEETVASGTAYPLATVLRPRRRMRMETQQVLREILTWIIAGLGLGAMIWLAIVLGVNWGT